MTLQVLIFKSISHFSQVNAMTAENGPEYSTWFIIRIRS